MQSFDGANIELQILNSKVFARRFCISFLCPAIRFSCQAARGFHRHKAVRYRVDLRARPTHPPTQPTGFSPPGYNQVLHLSGLPAHTASSA